MVESCPCPRRRHKGTTTSPETRDTERRSFGSLNRRYSGKRRPPVRRSGDRNKGHGDRRLAVTIKIEVPH